MTNITSACAEVKRVVHHRHQNPIPGEDRRWRDAVGHLPRDFFYRNFSALQAAFYEAEAEIVSQRANTKIRIT
jgi:hypothetical protein